MQKLGQCYSNNSHVLLTAYVDLEFFFLIVSQLNESMYLLDRYFHLK